MEEEIDYSTVVFKNCQPTETKNKEDQTIYSEVKPATAPKKKEEPSYSETVKPEGAAATLLNGEAAARSQHFYLLAVCLGILCVLLLGVISAIIYISVVMNEQKANLNNLTAENQQMIRQKRILENETEELRRDRDDLNWTLGVILTFNTFPVNKYCPQKKCQPCLTDWIPFQEKCYLFWNGTAPWKAWDASQKYCKDNAADLVVIDSLQEQEFITNHIEYYWDNDHGFWIGLSRPQSGQNWTWVDGREVTLQYWIKTPLDDAKCTLVLPGIGRKATASWNVTTSWDAPEECEMQNKFICESEKDVLIKPN